MLKNVLADTARDMLLDLPVRRRVRAVPLEQACGRVLAEDIYAAIPIPPFNRSPYDGYALRAVDTADASPAHPAVFSVTEELPAGAAPKITLGQGEAARIMTGAPLPEGADAVVKYEITQFTPEQVKIFYPLAPQTDIIFAGEDIARDQLIAQTGALITAPIVGMLASQGIAEVKVYDRPLATIINTGSELVEIGFPLQPAKIYNSNAYTLGAYLRELGVEVKNGGVAADELDAIAAAIDAALPESDFIITTGGAASGDYDWAVASAEKINARVLFWKAHMKPGGAIMAAEKEGRLILGLSGSPGAALIGLLRIALPYIRKCCGRNDVLPEVVEVILKNPVKKASPRPRILRGRLEIRGGAAYFTENEGQGNGVVSSFIGCDLLGEVPEGSPPVPAGTKIKAYRI